MSIKLGDKENRFGKGWARHAWVDGIEYRVGVEQGKAVRIAYKPRGQNIGHQYHGWVMRDGRNLYSGQVSGSIGARGLLKRAGVVALKVGKCWECYGRLTRYCYRTERQVTCERCNGTGQCEEFLT